MKKAIKTKLRAIRKLLRSSFPTHEDELFAASSAYKKIVEPAVHKKGKKTNSRKDGKYEEIIKWLAKYDSVVIELWGASSIKGDIIDVAYVPVGLSLKGIGKDGKDGKTRTSKLVVAVLQDQNVALVNIRELFHREVGPVTENRLVALKRALPIEGSDALSVSDLDKWFKTAGLI